MALVLVLNGVVLTALPHRAEAHQRDTLVFVPARLKCFGAGGAHSPTEFTPTTVFRLGRTHDGQVAGFALYRTWAQPRWLQVEAASDASLCAGPWSMGADGQNASYTYADHNGRPAPPGRYYLAILRVRQREVSEEHPYRTVYAQLSTHRVHLPAPGFLSIWSCDNSGPGAAACVSPYFDLP